MPGFHAPSTRNLPTGGRSSACLSAWRYTAIISEPTVRKRVPVSATLSPPLHPPTLLAPLRTSPALPPHQLIPQHPLSNHHPSSCSTRISPFRPPPIPPPAYSPPSPAPISFSSAVPRADSRRLLPSPRISRRRVSLPTARFWRSIVGQVRGWTFVPDVVIVVTVMKEKAQKEKEEEGPGKGNPS